jgi:hypothetical protein
MSTFEEVVQAHTEIVNERLAAEAFVAMSLEQRIAHVRDQIANGRFKEDQLKDVRELMTLCSIYGDWEQPYYRYRMAIEGLDPVIVAAEMKYTDDARTFLQAYGLERSKPYLSSRLWLQTYHHHNNTPGIVEILKSRGAEKIAEEVRKTPETGSSSEPGRLTMARHFIKIFGIRAACHLESGLASKLKGRQLEDELGL